MSLRELPRVRQVAGEPRRRWFHGHEMDLVVWEGEDGAPLGFQLAYDKHRDGHSITWRAGHGFAQATSSALTRSSSPAVTLS